MPEENTAYSGLESKVHVVIKRFGCVCVCVYVCVRVCVRKIPGDMNEHMKK